jgi:hypothetical protein
MLRGMSVLSESGSLVMEVYRPGMHLLGQAFSGLAYWCQGTLTVVHANKVGLYA